MAKGQRIEYQVTSKITADLLKMGFLRCEQDILNIRLIAVSETETLRSHYTARIFDEKHNEVPILRKFTSDIYSTNARVLYSPFSSK